MGYLQCLIHRADIYATQWDISFYGDEKIVGVSADKSNILFHTIQTNPSGQAQYKKIGWCIVPENSGLSYDENNYKPKHIISCALLPSRFYLKDLTAHNKPQITQEPDTQRTYQTSNVPYYGQINPPRHRMVTYNHGYEHVGPIELIPTQDTSFYGNINSYAPSIIHVFELEPWSSEFHQKVETIL